MAYGVESEGKTLSGPRDYAYGHDEPKRRKKMAQRDSSTAGGKGGQNLSGGFTGQAAAKPSSNSKTLRGSRDSMSTGDMADELPLKVTRVKKRKAQLDSKEKKPPAGAQTGALGSAPLQRVTTGLRTIFRSKGGSPSGNPTGEINLRNPG